MGCLLACLDRNFWMNLSFGGPHLGVVLKPATESREDQSKLSQLLDFGPILRTATPVGSMTLPEVCNPLPDASCGDLTNHFDQFKWSRARSCATSEPWLVPESGQGTSWSTTPPLSHFWFFHWCETMENGKHHSRRQEL